MLISGKTAECSSIGHISGSLETGDNILTQSLPTNDHDTIISESGTTDPLITTPSPYEMLELDSIAPRNDAVPLNEYSIAPRNDAVPLNEDSIAPRNDAVPLNEDSIAPRNDAVPLNEDSIAPRNDAVPLNEDSIAPRNDAVPLNEVSIAPSNDAVPLNEDSIVPVYVRDHIYIQRNETDYPFPPYNDNMSPIIAPPQVAPLPFIPPTEQPHQVQRSVGSPMTFRDYVAKEWIGTSDNANRVRNVSSQVKLLTRLIAI